MGPSTSAQTLGFPLCRRKLIHHRKETLARRTPSSAGHKPGLPSSNSEISLSQTPPPPPNGLKREYGRQGSMPFSGSMDSMQGEQGFYQVTSSSGPHPPAVLLPHLWGGYGKKNLLEPKTEVESGETITVPKILNNRF